VSNVGHRLGLLGGTFDPPHYGHLIAAQEAAEQLRLEQVLFMPAAEPPHKQCEPITPLETRIRMVELAIAGNPCFALSLADAERPGPSYTADLLGQVQAEAGPDTELYFIVGTDSLRDLLTWREPARVLAQCTLVVASRPGYEPLDPRALEASIPSAASRVRLLGIPGVHVSSTDLRARAAAGRSIRYLTPDPVRALIEMEGLYGLLAVGGSRTIQPT
jgi:nicotinate-nucleotide adenylyltransferase